MEANLAFAARVAPLKETRQAVRTIAFLVNEVR